MHFLIISAALLAATGAFAQSKESATLPSQQNPCDAYIESSIDSISGEYTTASRDDIIIMKDGKETLSIVFLIVDRSIVFSIAVVGGVYCVDETNKITITFRDGTAMELPHNGKFNCDGEYLLFFLGPFGKKKEYFQLATTEIDKIKLSLRKSVVDKNRANFVEAALTPQNSKEIKTIAECLME
jgi:hypothetical protein